MQAYTPGLLAPAPAVHATSWSVLHSPFQPCISYGTICVAGGETGLPQGLSGRLNIYRSILIFQRDVLRRLVRNVSSPPVFARTSWASGSRPMLQLSGSSADYTSSYQRPARSLLLPYPLLFASPLQATTKNRPHIAAGFTISSIPVR